MNKQLSFEKISALHRYAHGGILRKKRQGRNARPLSSRSPLHLVFKVNKEAVRGGLRTYRRYFLIQKIIQKYARRFFIRVEIISIQNDHIHLLIRAPRREFYQSFFRVVAGQIAQTFANRGLSVLEGVTDTPRRQEKAAESGLLKLWKVRPFTRVVKGWKAYLVCRNYIKLNEAEALHIVSYSEKRLCGLSSSDWNLVFG